MAIISKDDNLAWGAYLLIGFVAFFILPGILIIILMYDISAYIKLPLSLLTTGVTLYAFKRYLGLYVEDSARLSVLSKMHKMGIGWIVSVLFFSAIVAYLYLTGHYTIVGVKFNLDSQLGVVVCFLVGWRCRRNCMPRSCFSPNKRQVEHCCWPDSFLSNLWISAHR